MDKKEIDKRFSDLFVGTFGFNEEEYNYFLSHFTKMRIKKKDFYSKAGDLSNAKAYINKGCARTYVTDEGGNERILFFSFEDFWICDFASFNSGLPGNHNVEMLEDCELLVITKDDWKKMEKEIPKILMWYTVKVPKSASGMLKRLIDEKISSAEERYLNLVKSRPEIFQRVPLKHIAAFLNIQPQSLSRMRKRLIGL